MEYDFLPQIFGLYSREVQKIKGNLSTDLRIITEESAYGGVVMLGGLACQEEKDNVQVLHMMSNCRILDVPKYSLGTLGSFIIIRVGNLLEKA